MVKRSDALKEIANAFEECTEDDVKSKYFICESFVLFVLTCIFFKQRQSPEPSQSPWWKIAANQGGQKKSGSAPVAVKWEYFKAMEFLLGETADAGPVDSMVLIFI